MLSLRYLIFASFLCSCQIQKNIDKVYQSTHKSLHQKEINTLLTVKEMHADIDFWFKKIEEVHPNPFLNISKEELNLMCKNKKQEISTPLSHLQFYKKIAPIITTIGDGHTRISLTSDFMNFYFSKRLLFPFQIEILADSNMRIINNYSSNNEIKSGDTIISINQRFCKNIVDELLLYSQGESYDYRTSIYSEDVSKINLVLEEEKFELSFSNGLKETVSGISLDSLLNSVKRSKPLLRNSEHFSYNTLDSNIHYITIMEFSDDPDIFEKKIDSIFRKIPNEIGQYLILDVRNNVGGDSRLGEIIINRIYEGSYTTFSSSAHKKSKSYKNFLKKTLVWWLRPLVGLAYNMQLKSNYGELSYFRENPYIHDSTCIKFKGQVYVISGLHNFSSGTAFVGIIKDYKVAPIIGEETGGQANSFGDIYPFDLPNSHLWCSASVKIFIRPNGDETSRGGYLPDYFIGDNPITDKDEMLERTLQLIKQKSSK